MTYLMGIDNGGTMTKAALFDAQGREIAVAAENTPLITPRPGYYERDMTLLWRTNAACIREVIRKAGVSPARHCGRRLYRPRQRAVRLGEDGRPRVRHRLDRPARRRGGQPVAPGRHGA